MDIMVLSRMKADVEKLVAEVQDIQKGISAAVQKVNALQSQVTENKMVKDELEQLDDDARIYKLVGPILIPQEPEEAKNTVSTRMGYISKELASAKMKIEKLEKLLQEKRIKLLADQQKFQALAQRVAASSSGP